MAQLHKRDIGGTAVIDGIELRWLLIREPQWCTADGWKGMAISVRVADGAWQELLLEYPFRRLSERPRISPKAIESDIRTAISAGWEPFSRGRPFAFQVPPNSN